MGEWRPCRHIYAMCDADSVGGIFTAFEYVVEGRRVFVVGEWAQRHSVYVSNYCAAQRVGVAEMQNALCWYGLDAISAQGVAAFMARNPGGCIAYNSAFAEWRDKKTGSVISQYGGIA